MASLRLFKFIFICSFILIPFLGAAAELSWNGGPITVGNGDRLVITDGMPQSADNVTVEEGGTLVIANNLQITNSFNNKGTIQVTGYLNIPESVSAVENTGTMIFSPPENLEDAGATAGFDTARVAADKFQGLLENGRIIIGNQNITSLPTGAENIRKAGLNETIFVLPGDAENPNHELINLKFNTTQFVTEFRGKVNNEILMAPYGIFRFNSNPATISGNELTIGKITFDEAYSRMQEVMAAGMENYDEINYGMSRIRGRNITLEPDGDTVTLNSGILQVAAGRNPAAENPEAALSTLNIGKDKNKTLHINGGAVLLGGGGNQQGDVSVNGNVIIGNENSEIINSAMITRAGDWTLNGDLTLNKSGYLSVGETTYKGYTSTLTINGNFNSFTKYTIDQNILNVLKNTVGNEDTALEVTDGGILKIGKAQINGGQIILAESALNPADNPEQQTIARYFREAANIINAPQGAIAFDSDKIDARINVGKNSLLTLGSNNPQWLLDKVSDYQTRNNKTWGEDITAVLAVRTPQTLSPIGGINIDGKLNLDSSPATVNQARFGDKSLFVVDASGLGGKTALTGDGAASSLVVESGAQLLVTDAAAGEVIKITDKFPNTPTVGWTADVSTPLLEAEGELLDPKNGTYIVRINDGASPQTAFPLLSSELASIVAQAKIRGLNTESPNQGIKFISRAVDNRYIGANDAALAAATIESVARIATLGAAPQMTLAANNAAGAAITQRTSFAQPDGLIMAIDESGNYIMKSKERFERNFALWIMPLYQSTNGFDMEAGNFDYNFNGALGGVALGADYTFEDAFRIGVAFNIGGGYAQGTGDLNKTTNNMNFWGVGAYAGWSQNNFGLTADVNYTSTYNKIKQELPEAMQMGDLKSDIRGNAISTGLRAEYKIVTDNIDFVPHAGFRYTNLFFNPYNAKRDGKVLHGDKFYQNIWTFPIGVTFTKEFPLANNWHFKPLLDVNLTPAAGNIKAKSRVKFNGIREKADVKTKIMDYITYGGTAGIEFGNDVISIGVDYSGQFGAESSAHSVFGTLRVEF